MPIDDLLEVARRRAEELNDPHQCGFTRDREAIVDLDPRYGYVEKTDAYGVYWEIQKVKDRLAKTL